MPIRIPGRVVLLDYGQVISRPQTDRAKAELLTAAGRPDPDRFWAAYAASRHDLDRGTLPIAEYWRRIGAALGQTWDDGRIAELWTADLRSWISADPEVVQLIADLRAGATRLALLSNAAADYGSVLRLAPWAVGFEGVFVSGELRLLKPERAIFERVARELGVPPERIVFVDDRADNVAGATALGITAHRFTSALALRRFLESLAGRPNDGEVADRRTGSTS